MRQGRAAPLCIDHCRIPSHTGPILKRRARRIGPNAKGALLFNEGVDRATTEGATTVGAAIIIASGPYIVLREGRADASTNRPVLGARVRAGTGSSVIVSPW